MEIRPRKVTDRGGYIAMPLVKEDMFAGKLCTMCALKRKDEAHS